ncbi:uncharacterized protein LOC120358084 [Solenopsis invicta]|uniref:uncharacterized protein LOC120358084 n=1 Tax=Solenopsis invicta TaxID=13686 RepID=UPI00193EAFDE|nr:uncharacterized protein LOC120358084 [Solenopsis invicta]
MNNTEIQENDNESNDPDYDPDYIQSEQSSITSDFEETDKLDACEDDSKCNKRFSNTQNNDSAISTGIDVSNNQACEIRQDDQTEIPTKLTGTKKYMCVFCHKMQTKIARHLELIHSEEPDVQKFKYLPKGCSERRKIIDSLRKQGNFKFNINKQYENKGFIPCRRPRENNPKLLKNYLACGSCKGHYLKSSIRHHFRKCTGRSGKQSRIVKVMGRKIEGKCHKEADKKVRRLILPTMRSDGVSYNIRYDDLLILYANTQSKKYRHSTHHIKMIRARLRLVTRLLIAMKSIDNNITSLTSIYDPKYYDTLIDAVNIVAQYNKEKDIYEKPANASNLGTYVKHIGELLITKCIKEHNDTMKINTKNFLKLLTVDYGSSVNKTVVESQTQFKRQKSTKLPTINDIKTLRSYLLKVQRESYNKLQNKFLLSAWISLGEATLTSIQLFNRRRPGETERILISDFENYEKINDNIETFNGLPTDKKEQAQKYVRFCIRGKKGRTVPVILDELNLKCLRTFLQFRHEAKVHPSNPYLFGIPGHDKAIEKYLCAYKVLKRFAKENGSEFPETISSTKLRKHIATMGITLNLTDNQITDLANFMGHHEKIHKEVYRNPVIVKDITEISQLLEAAQGVRDEANNLIDETDSEDASETENSTDMTENDDTFPEVNLQQSNDSSSSFSTYKERTKTELKAIRKKTRKSKDEPIKRTAWTEDEKRIILETFKTSLQTDTTITGKEMQNLISITPCLAQRTVPQMRA